MPYAWGMGEVVRMSWGEAPSRLRGMAAGRTPCVVAITGRVGAGKSTLAMALSACVIATDNYLPDYSVVPEAERDDPRHADFARLVEDVAALREGKRARVPVWSFQTHRREGEREVEPAGLIVVEGIHAVHGAAGEMADVRVFVESPPAVRWDRWAHLERTGARGWGVPVAHAYFHGVAEPSFAKFEAAYRAACGVVVENDEGSPGG